MIVSASNNLPEIFTMDNDLDIKREIDWFNRQTPISDHTESSDFEKLGNLCLYLEETDRKKLETLQLVFIEQLNSKEKIQQDVLQVLLKQLVIITLMAKKKYLTDQPYEGERFELVRQFNLLVDKHYKQQHQIQFYAGLLKKSPKTISNFFKQYNYKTPSLIIHDRIIAEAKRLFYYTDKSGKEISYELGFSDPAHFSRFFKKATKQSPSDFRCKVKQVSPYF